MFETFQTLINAGGYDLADFTERIKTMYVMGELTEDEMKQLLEQAQDNAKPDDSYAPLADRVKAIEEWETTIEERLSKLESGSSTDSGEPEKPGDEWSEYKQPTGALQNFTVTAQASSSSGGASTLSIYPAITPTGAYQNVSASPANGAAGVITSSVYWPGVPLGNTTRETLRSVLPLASFSGVSMPKPPRPVCTSRTCPR